MLVCRVTLCVRSQINPVPLPSVCSTPDYITPEMPQVANEFDDDKVGKMRFFSFLSVGMEKFAAIVCCVEQLLFP